MKNIRFSSLTVIAALVGATTAAQAFEAHEWGTFTSLIGSNGLTQNGMYHEDEVLPNFVHGFGDVQGDTPPAPPPPRDPCRGKGCFNNQFFDNNVISQKMETPVIYFYSDKQQHVELEVHFPDGLLTDTFPAPIKSYPAKSDNPDPHNGQLMFSFDILPQFFGAFPVVDPTNIYSHARNVMSNIVQAGPEQERFIFYRGLGRFQPRIDIRSEEGNLDIYGATADLPTAAFLVHVDEAGDAQMIDLGDLSTLLSKRSHTVSAELINKLKNHFDKYPGVLKFASAKDHMVQALIGAGLHTDEAVAMINTWQNGYLKVAGLRLLYLLPRAEVDTILPLHMTPAPDTFVRAFIGRMEILTDLEEQRILHEVLKAGDKFSVSGLGRFAEATLRRIKEVYVNERNNRNEDPRSKVVELFDQLISKAALATANTGSVE